MTGQQWVLGIWIISRSYHIPDNLQQLTTVFRSCHWCSVGRQNCNFFYGNMSASYIFKTFSSVFWQIHELSDECGVSNYQFVQIRRCCHHNLYKLDIHVDVFFSILWVVVITAILYVSLLKIISTPYSHYVTLEGYLWLVK